MNHNLAMRLRTGTQESHTLAENTAFMKLFLKGIVIRDIFRRFLANLYFVYVALESEILWYRTDSVVGLMYFPILERSKALEQDLAFYYGDDWRDQVTPSAATLRYVMRIHAIANDYPELLVAHAYVRYMGDLSGGQGLRAIARVSLDLPADQGTAFYEFEVLPTVEMKRAFKGKYRDALNTLPIGGEQVTQIVEEANLAFKLNRDVMHDLASMLKKAVGEQVFARITEQHHAGSTERRKEQLQREVATKA